MENLDSLITDFSVSDAKRVKTHLTKLLPYIDINKMVIVGGLAIRYLLTKAGIKYPIRPFNDLDLMVKEASDVSPKVSNDFLIYHYHPPRNNSFYIVLVDPVSKTKVDIFDWDPPLEEFITVDFKGYQLKMRSTEDQLVKTVYDIQRISEEKKVDPKQFEDTKLLMQIVDLKKANKIWRKRNFKDYPNSLQKAVERANKIAKQHPEWLQRDPFKIAEPYQCVACKSTKKFKITPMKEIYKILRYVA